MIAGGGAAMNMRSTKRHLTSPHGRKKSADGQFLYAAGDGDGRVLLRAPAAQMEDPAFTIKTAVVSRAMAGGIGSGHDSPADGYA